MILRSFKTLDYNLNGRTLQSFLGRTPLYPTAYPWNQTGNKYGDVMPMALAGKAPAVTSTQDLWAGTGVRTLPNASFTLAISSSSVADASAGTGARTVEVDVIEATTYAAKTIALTLNGQTKVTDAGGTLCWRINAVRVTSWGTGNANAGVIYAFDSTDTVTSGVPATATKIFAVMAIGDNFAKQAMYTVPAGYQALNLNTRGGITDITNTNRSAILTFGRSVTLNGTVPVFASFEIGGAISINGPIFVEPEHGIIIDEKQEIRIQASASAAAAMVVYSDFILFPKG